MTSQTPDGSAAGGPLVDGPHDPEHDPTASYALDRGYVARLTERVVASSGRTAAVATPLTGAPLAHVPQSSEDDVAEAFRRARRAQASWARVPVAERARLLLRLHDLVLDRQDEILDLICWESGKARKHAADEPLHVALTARYYGRTAERHLRSRRVPGLVPGSHPGRGEPGAQGRRRDHRPLELPVRPRAHRRAARAAGRQRRRHQARRADHALRAARRPAARRGRAAGRPVAGRGRARRRDRDGDGAGGRLRVLHRLHRHRQARRPAVRRPAGRLLARARRQEPAPRAARRRPRARGRGRRPRLLLQRRPAVRLDRAALRRRPGLRPVRAAVRGPHRGDDARRQPRLGQRHGLLDLAGPARHRRPPRRRRRRPGRPRAHRRPAPPRPRPLRLRAHGARGRHARPWRASARRPSARWCRSTASTTRRTPSRGPTPASTASTPRSGAATAPAPGRSPAT